MNTIELSAVVGGIINKNTHFLGVLAYDQLTTERLQRLPAMCIVNTHPSTMPGEHWLAVYISRDRRGYFFDSFGHSLDSFPPAIKMFLLKNGSTVLYSGKQVQNDFSITCGQHCVFFLYHMQNGVSYARLLNMYGSDLICNDAMVCRFVNNIQPVAVCSDYVCVQCGY